MRLGSLLRVLCCPFLLALALPLFAQQTPLSELPYTPSLETRFMDTSVDPCNDFYRYACGQWSKLNPLPPDEAAWDVYSKMADDNLRYLWGILQRASQPSASRSPVEAKIGDYFQACLDEGSVERAGLHPLTSGLAAIASLKSIDDLAAYVASQHRAGLDGDLLFAFAPDQDFDDSSRMIAFANAGGLGLPDRDYYDRPDAKSQEIRQRYLGHLQHMFAFLGESAADAATDARTVLDIETSLARSSLSRTEKRNPYNLKHKMDQAALARLAPSFAWGAYFQGLGLAITEINVSEPKFFTELNRQLRTQNLAAWRAYLRWHLIHGHAAYLSSPFDREQFAFFSQYLAGAKEMPARWKKCSRLVDSQLGDALGQIFVAHTFTGQTRDDAVRMIEQVEREMAQDMETLSWMGPETRRQALDKLHSLVNKVGYPAKWKDYSSVAISRETFFLNAQNAESFEQRRRLAKIGQPVDRSEWTMTPPTVNAYYNAQTNDINFPAGVLQPPLFDPKMDAAPNYGNTAATMGHELTHGFDDEGRQFDARGNLRDWWSPADAKAFEERVACVRDQYAQYVVVDDLHINSRLTLGEDVADLGGTLLAYLAWKHATAGQNLPPIANLTPDQRFFVGMAQWACGETRPELQRMRVITDPHSPLEFRVNGVVSNLPQFGQAFGCRPGQPMMHQNACRVW